MGPLYNYKALEKLSIDWDELDTLDEKGNVYIVSYAVHDGGQYPFLEIGMINQYPGRLNQIGFPKVRGIKKDEILNAAKIKMDIILYDDKTYLEGANQDKKKEIEEEYEWKGFIRSHQDVYIFVDVSRWKNNNIMVMQRYSFLWFVMISEIIYDKNTCTYEWGSVENRFFSNNQEFLVLNDEYDKPYPIPRVRYQYNHEKKLKFTAIFGPQKDERGEYYFRDYENTLVEGRKEYDKRGILWGVVKFAVYKEPVEEVGDVVGLSYHCVEKKEMEDVGYGHYVM